MTSHRTLAVLTAIADRAWEASLVGGLERAPLGVTVARRCVDVADLLAVAATGVAVAAVLSADLRRLDRDAIARLAAAGVVVVGVVPIGDEAGERRLRQLGVSTLVPASATALEVATAVVASVAAGPRSVGGFTATTEVGGDRHGDIPAPLLAGTGRLVAVWGPAGAPGRTSVAIGLAAEFAAMKLAPLLVDADVYGGTVSQLLGLLEETPGLAAACRLANVGTLDVARLAALARSLDGGLRVLPGISRPSRWPELRTAAFETVLDLCRTLAVLTVIDCGFSLESDEELMYDTAAPRRNGATLAALAAADTVVVVGSGDPVGVQRLVRGLADLRETIPGVSPVVVVNRSRRGAVGGDPRREVGAALTRYAGVVPAAYVPYDLAAFDAAVAAGRTLEEVAPGSPARKALAGLAATIAGRSGERDSTRWRPRRQRSA